MERERQLQEIHRQLSDICTKAKLENTINIYSVNLIFENLLRDILNCIYECQFENANYICHNQQGYDLIEADLKIVVQVSAENRAGKIQHSLDHLGLYETEGWRFCFFLLGESAEKLRKKDYQISSPVTFRPKEDIWDMSRLIKKINNLDSDKVYSVYHLLCNRPCVESMTKRDIWNSVYKDYQMCMEEHFYISEEEIGWQKDRSGSVYFNILKRLLPNGYVSLNGIDANGVNEYGERISLSSLTNQDFYENMTVIGEGGIGKTTFLRNIMNHAYKDGIYKDGKSIPIYIELSRTPAEIGSWYSKRTQKSNFIIRYIAGLVYGLEWHDSSKEAMECHEAIEQELQKTAVQGKEEYLLLLDGLNEVSMRKVDKEGRTISDYLCMEITAMRKYCNLKIILTSRRVRQAYTAADAHVVELVGIQDEDVGWYLEKSGFSRIRINRILTDQELMKCLRVPLFLCMFGNRKAEGAKTPCSRGEILYNFFHRDSPYYNEHRTAERIQGKQYLNGTQITFIVDFLLPYIGWTMEYIELYSLEESYLESLIEEFLQDDERVLMSDEVEAFSFYRKKHVRVSDIRKELSCVSYEKILECITEGLGILYINHEGEGCFVHQHIRDYFAAVYEVQILRVAYALSNEYKRKGNKRILEKCGELLSEINENIWSEIKCSFVGEIAGEPRNRPYYKDGRWVKGKIVLEEQRFLNHALKTFRTTNILPIEGLYNLTETMKLTRKDLSGTNFSGLDLRGCRFNGAVCSHKISGHSLAADFHGSKISDETFQEDGHKGIVLRMQLSYDGENLFTFGEDGFLILWDSRTGKRQYSVHTGIGLCKTGEELTRIEIMTDFEAALCRRGRLIKCNVRSGVVAEFEKPDKCVKITDFTYNPKTGKIAAVYDGNCVAVYDGETGAYELTCTSPVLCAWSLPNQEILLLVQEENNVILKKGNHERGVYLEIGRFHNKEHLLLADYCGQTNRFAARCAEGIFVMDPGTGWWNTYSVEDIENIKMLQCHRGSAERITLVYEKCCMEFDYEEQESWIVFQDERIAFPDMVQCAGGKVFFMDQYEHAYLANVSTGDIKRVELSDTTIVQKLFVDGLRKHIIIVDSRQNVTVYDVGHNQMLMNIQYHQNGEVSSRYCYHEPTNIFAMAAADHYCARVFLIDLNTQQEKEIYSEITGKEITEIVFSIDGKRLLIAIEKRLLSLSLEDGKVQVIENSEDYRIHYVHVLYDDTVEVCMYCPVESIECGEKEAYAYRTVYQYDTVEEKYTAMLNMMLPKLRDEHEACWAFGGREVSYLKNDQPEIGYLNIAVAWKQAVKDIEKNQPVESPNYKKYCICDLTVPMAISYDTMLLIQSYYRSNYRMLEYGRKGFFVRDGNIIYEFFYTEKGICEEPRVIKPIIMDGEMMEVSFITWGFEGNYYSILANGKVVEINELGEIKSEFPIHAGISIAECDFKGTDINNDLKKTLMFHGGIFS
jgi:WD40 repeat protein